MSTRTSARSQRAFTASKSRSHPPRGTQPGPSHSQHATRRATRIEEEDEDDDDDDDDGDGQPEPPQNDAEDPDADILANGNVDTDTKRKAAELVRLALFTEHKRMPLKRDDITKKVLGSNSRTFALVLDCAQDILQKTFGMELAELPSRAGLDADTNEADDELNEARKATGMKKKAAAVGSKTYILRSVLHPLIIEHAAQTDENILEQEVTDLPGNDDEGDDDEGYVPQCYGSIISWSQTDYLGPIGLLYTLLALILVSGRVLSDVELRTHLKSLGLTTNSQIPFPTHATHRSVPVEQYLGTLIRQGYLDRYHSSGADAAGGAGASKRGAAGAKRGRVSLGGHGDDGDIAGGGQSYEWRWGPRAMSEVGEKAVAKFVAEFMVGSVEGDDDDDEEEEANGGRRGRRGGGKKEGAEKRLEKMLHGVERAAGGNLADVK